MEQLLDRLAPKTSVRGGGDATKAPTTPTTQAPPPSGGEASGTRPGQRSDQSAKAPTAGAASSGDLWGQIAPCWKPRSAAVRTAVTLSVTLDKAGRLTIPPVIQRPRNAPPDEARLRAEASALAAIALCLPDGDIRFGGKTFQLHFEPGV